MRHNKPQIDNRFLVMNHEAKVQDGTNSVWSDSVRTERMYRMVQMKYSENQPNLELKPEDDIKVTFQSLVSFQFNRP